MADTFTFCHEGRRHIAFLRFSSNDFPKFLLYLGEKLGVQMGDVQNIAFAEVSEFHVDGNEYTAIAGDDEECSVVAPDEAARVALLQRIFGPDLASDLHAVG